MLSQLCYGLIDMLTDPIVIASMIFMVIGICFSGLAMRITKAVRKSSDIKQDDKLLLSLRAIGFILMIAGLGIMIFEMVRLI